MGAIQLSDLVTLGSLAQGTASSIHSPASSISSGFVSYNVSCQTLKWKLSKDFLVSFLSSHSLFSLTESRKVLDLWESAQSFI